MDIYELKNAILTSATFQNRAEIWPRYLKDLQPEDVCLEFGVFRGDSINAMAKAMPKNCFFGFDSFEGLPSAWKPDRPAGHFKVTDRAALKFEPNIEIVEGLFEHTLPRFLSDTNHARRRFTRIHVNCDIYASTASVLTHLEEIVRRDKPLILFNEFYNYLGFEDHEFKAFLEFVNRTGISFEVLGHTKWVTCLIAIK